VALLALLMEVGPLTELSRWEPVGSLLETLMGSLKEVDCITKIEIIRLRGWARRWRSLDPTLRLFYETQTAGIDPPKVVDKALWFVLQPEGRRRLSGYEYRTLKSLWIKQFGDEPELELAPTIWIQGE